MKIMKAETSTNNTKEDEDPDDVGNLDRDEKDDEARGPTLQVEIQATNDDAPHTDDDEDDVDEDDDDDEEEGDDDMPKKQSPASIKAARAAARRLREQEEEELLNSQISDDPLQDPEYTAHLDKIKAETPKTDLEVAFAAVLNRKEQHISRLVGEISKLKGFIAKRKQTYKRKRKDEGAPTRALSAYNIFVQDRFARLAKENAAALKSTDTNIQMQRVPPANLVASTGNAWKALPAEEKAKYEERAKADRKRYDEQMAKYQPPDKHSNRKRNKTGYNMFFSAHVLRLKQSEMGVPSERGSVARLVGNAWKALTAEEKQYYEREADKHNGMNPVDPTKDEDDDEEEIKQPQVHHVYDQAAYAAHDLAAAAGYAQIHGGMHPATAQHDPRQHAYYYPHQHGYYDYTAAHHHHQQQQLGRSRGHPQYQYPPQQGHGY
ncbi:HMG high mobility group box-containing protein [Nitzschia inconspicua]|uniref:HMG high mobility group box-containing protein n=1 Tax=Nitzschia inconspicua TaxID=303405 RepID=A0A9K3K843_9STRA|nr:HMG high mobility group box-containing protein [Nitzschia inconspicua]KAG7364108.1 HMG high mobility group box-containing protein [Nitzschia inconspicua]